MQMHCAYLQLICIEYLNNSMFISDLYDKKCSSELFAVWRLWVLASWDLLEPIQTNESRTYVQAGLSLCWWHIPHYWKSHVVTHLFCATLIPNFYPVNL